MFWPDNTSDHIQQGLMTLRSAGEAGAFAYGMHHAIPWTRRMREGMCRLYGAVVNA